MKNEEVVILPIDKILPSPRNPRKMKDTQFNFLVQNIQENGFNDPVLVDKGFYQDGVLTGENEFVEVVDGNHRLRAAKLLGFTELPCIIFPKRLTPLQRDYMGVRYNTLHNAGFVKDKFTEIVNDLLKEFKDREEVIGLFMQDRDEFERYYQDIRKDLPQEIKDRLPETSKEIKTVDDLAQILNKMFNDYGTTLEYNFMIFDWGGRDNLWIRCDYELWEAVKNLADKCKDEKTDINEVMKKFILRKEGE